MTLTDDASVERLISQIETQPDDVSRSGLLRPLNLTATIVLIGALTVMVTMPPLPALRNFLLVGTSLLINLLVFGLDRWSKTPAAALIFCIWINAAMISLFFTNLLINKELIQAAIFSCALSLSVLLAGMLLNSRWGFGFAVVNALTVVTGNSLFRLQNPPEDQPLVRSISSISTPVIAFLMMIAVVSWLYQRALRRQQTRLQKARDQILRDELLRKEVSIARDLQQQLYPPAPRPNPYLSIASLALPARETGGDFYDFLELDERRLGIVVADVIGKSLGAALVMTMARSMLRSEAYRYESPAAVLNATNQSIMRDRAVRQILTCFYGVLDLESLELRFANAGHPYPTLRRNGLLRELQGGDLPLGSRSDVVYQDMTIRFEPGDQLVLMSDGAFEERNGERELFGFDRLHTTISGLTGDDPEQTVQAIAEAVEQFRGGHEQSDDLTLVAIQIEAREGVESERVVGEPRTVVSQP